MLKDYSDAVLKSILKKENDDTVIVFVDVGSRFATITVVKFLNKKGIIKGIVILNKSDHIHDDTLNNQDSSNDGLDQ